MPKSVIKTVMFEQQVYNYLENSLKKAQVLIS